MKIMKTAFLKYAYICVAVFKMKVLSCVEIVQLHKKFKVFKTTAILPISIIT